MRWYPRVRLQDQSQPLQPEQSSSSFTCMTLMYSRYSLTATQNAPPKRPPSPCPTQLPTTAEFYVPDTRPLLAPVVVCERVCCEAWKYLSKKGTSAF